GQGFRGRDRRQSVAQGESIPLLPVRYAHGGADCVTVRVLLTTVFWLCGGGAMADQAWPLPHNPPIAIAGGKATNAAGTQAEIPSFRISKFEITNAEYQRFVAETGHRPS